ncbi:patatin-domain-containing protein [Aureobasidium sp. EXF-10727]|nr:patatin-domain-containing protein [Aureobasidium sp. EXF-10727]
MDFFHDSLVLPGSSAALGSNATTDNASSRPNVRSSRVSPSLIRALRDPYHLIGAKPVEAGSQRQRAEGPQLDDSEWRRQVLNLKISQAKCYTDWLSAASELDTLEGRDAWKDDEECDEYDTALLKARLQELEDARISCDAKRMLVLARTSLTRDLAGMGDLRLYKHCRVGTKTLIERYISAALDMLDTIVDMCSPANKKDTDLDVREVYEQLLSARQAFGRSALLLSGGGTLGMNHIGVLKTLFEARLLPRIISGASAGSIVAAVLCTKTDDEIPQVLREFCYGDLDVFEREGEAENVLKKVFRFCTKGALFDISNLIRVMKDLLGDMTFQEAYNRTRRILNIGVSTASLYELPRLLNYITAPNVMIWSAVATSCSVPFIFSPAQLLAKDPRTGLEVPWDQSPQRWIDGSVDNDLPMSRLAEMFNVNHFIVSQVNPHVVPFLERDDEIASFGAQSSRFALSAGPSWLRTVANLAKGEALHRMHVLAELGVLPTTMSKLRSVLSQRYSGDITILPEVSYTQFPRVLKNPTTDFMSQAMLSGETATWPKLSQVRNHCAIELALDIAVQKVRYGLVFSPSQIDLRLNAFASTAAPNEGQTRHARRASHGSPPESERPHLLTVPPTFSLRKPSVAQTMQASHISSASKHAGLHDDFASGQETAVDSGDADWSDSSLDNSPTRQTPKLWPAPTFISRSQPVTPNVHSKMYMSSSPALILTRMDKDDNDVTHGLVASPAEYKSVFQNARPYVEDGVDVSGTRGMVRRKRSLTTGFRGLWPPGR